MTAKLAELHVHLGGCVDHNTCLEMILSCPEPQWDVYERTFEAAYGYPSDARHVVARVAQGDAGARTRFQQIFEFGDADGGLFSKFDAKFALILVGDVAFRCLYNEDPVSRGIAAVEPVIHGIHRAHSRQGLSHVETRLYLSNAALRHKFKPFVLGVLEAYQGLPGTPKTQLILSLDRKDPLHFFPIIEEIALSPLGHMLVGVDFCSVEEGFPPKDLAPFLKRFKRFNEVNPERALALVYHVGESFNDKSLESAVRWVVEAALAGVNRLGHAIALGIDPAHFEAHDRSELVSERRDQIAYDLRFEAGLTRHGVLIDESALRQELLALSIRPDDERIVCIYDEKRLRAFGRRQDFAAEQIAKTQSIIEVCPTSNRRIGGILNDGHHPIQRFAKWGLPFVIASDDPGLFGVTLSEELERACQMLGWSTSEKQVLIERAWSNRSEISAGRPASGASSVPT